jgi:hypothetical protein
MIWIMLILLSAPTGIGAVAWLVTGRQRGPRSGRRGSDYPTAPRGPDDDPDFLLELAHRIRREREADNDA